MKRATKMARDCCDCGVIVASGDLRCRRCAELRKRRAEIRDLRARLDAALAQVAVLREALEGLLPSNAATKPNVVERDLCMGRMWLRVAGAYVTIEGSQCFDGKYGTVFGGVRRWTGDDFKTIEERFAAPIRAALAATPAPTHDYSGLCAAPSCEGHCGYVHARGCEAVREYLADHGGKPYRAPSPPDILHRVAERAMWLTAERLGERLNEVEGVRYTMANIDGTAIDTAAIIKEATRG